MGKKSREKQARREQGVAPERPAFRNDIAAPSRRSSSQPFSRPPAFVAPPPERPRQPAPAHASPPKPAPITPPTPVTPAQTPGLWQALRATGLTGLAAFILIALAVVYVIWAIIAYNAGPGTGAAKAVPGLLAWIPAAKVVVAGNGGAYFLWQIGLLLSLIGLLATVVMNLSSRLRARRKTWVGLALASLLLILWSWPQFGNWTVSYNSYVHRYASLQKFQAKQAQLTGQGQIATNAGTEAQLRTQALQQEIQFRYYTQSAAKYGVKVSDKDVAASYQQDVTSAGGLATFTKQLNDYLGWTPADFKRDVRQRLVQQKLNTVLAKKYPGEADPSNKDLKAIKATVYVSGLKWDSKLGNVQPTK